MLHNPVQSWPNLQASLRLPVSFSSPKQDCFASHGTGIATMFSPVSQATCLFFVHSSVHMMHRKLFGAFFVT
jgi:hypothetical protein